uniref:RHS repeat domain-containing protein n=1 Tax=Chitinivorax sp. B TaxID=2502235 RepID=UPI0010F77394
QDQRSEYRYDSAGRQLEDTVLVDGQRQTTQQAYDAAGNLIRVTDANQQVTRYVYDAANRRVFSIDALGAVEQTEYDAVGHVTRSTRYATPISLSKPAPTLDEVRSLLAPKADQDLRQQTVYDQAGRRIASIDSQGYLTEYRYDALGNQLSSTRYDTPLSVIGTLSAQRQVLQTFQTDASKVSLSPGDATQADRVRWVNNQLQLVSGPSTKPNWPGARLGGLNLTVNSSQSVQYRAEILLDNPQAQLMWRVHGIKDGQVAYHGLLFSNGQMSADQRIVDQGQTKAISASFQAGVTYIVEQELTSTGSIIYCYEKGKARADGFSTVLAGQWTQAGDWLGHSFAGPDLKTIGTASISNLQLTTGTPTAYTERWQQTFDKDSLGLRLDASQAPSPDWARVANGRLELKSGTSAIANWPGATTQGRSYSLSQGQQVRYRAEVSLENGVASLMWRVHGTKNGQPVSHSLLLENGRLRSHQGDANLNNLSFVPKPGVVYVVEHYISNSGSTLYLYEKGKSWVEGISATQTGGWDSVGDCLMHSFATPNLTAFGHAYVDNLRIESGLAGEAGLPAAQQVFELRKRLGQASNQLQTNRTTYDHAGRVRFEVNPAGAVTETRYNALGQVTDTIRYANPVADSWTDEASLKALLVANPAQDHTQRLAYDAAGRVRFQLTAENVVTEHRYDSFGNVIQQLRYAKPVAGNWTDAASLAALLQADPQDRSTRSLYDAQQRLRFSVDALGQVSERVYDAAGNVIQVTDYAQPVANSWTDETSLKALLKADAAQDRSRFTVYDQANRPRYQLDALGYVTVNQYDSLGRLVGLTRHAKPIARPATL